MNFVIDVLESERKRQLALALYGIPGCIKFGDFTLASGQKSPYYFDAKALISCVEEQRLVADAFADLLRNVEMDRVVGVPEAAIDMTALVGDRLSMPRIGMRKEPKAHGTGGQLYGIWKPEMIVTMIEDVATTAGSMIKAGGVLEQEGGLIVLGGIVIVDREQGGRQNMTEKGYGFASLLTISEILEALRDTDRMPPDQFQVVYDYVAAHRPAA